MKVVANVQGRRYEFIKEIDEEWVELFRTTDWIVYKEPGWQQVCNNQELTPYLNMLVFNPIGTDLYISQFVPFVDDIQVEGNTLKATATNCDSNYNCCVSSKINVLVSPHSEIPESTVKFTQTVDSPPIESLNVIWFGYGRFMSNNAPVLCSTKECHKVDPNHQEENLNDKLLGAIDGEHGFGVVCDADLHWTVSGINMGDDYHYTGATAFAYRCPSIPCRNKDLNYKVNPYNWWITTGTTSNDLRNKLVKIKEEGGNGNGNGEDGVNMNNLILGASIALAVGGIIWVASR